MPFHETRHIIGLVTAAWFADDRQRRSKNVGQDGFSPDEFDALMLTFAQPVRVQDYRPRYPNLEAEYNPFRETGTERGSSDNCDYSPYEER